MRHATRLSLCSALAVISCLLTAAPAPAQGLGGGVKGGLSLTTLTFDAEVPVTRRTGFVAGGFATLPVFGGITFQPEVLFVTKGARIDTGFPASIEVDYLEIPLLLRLPAGTGGLRLFAVAGPSFAWRLRARSRTTFSGATEEVDLAGETERLDLGAAAGAGVEIGRLILEGRYTHGIRNVDAAEGGQNIRNRAFTVLAGYRF